MWLGDKHETCKFLFVVRDNARNWCHLNGRIQNVIIDQNKTKSKKSQQKVNKENVRKQIAIVSGNRDRILVCSRFLWFCLSFKTAVDLCC